MSKPEWTDKASGKSVHQLPGGMPGATHGGTRAAGTLAGTALPRTAASSGARPIKRGGAAATTAGSKSRGQPAKRFVDPFQYDEAQRRAILDALADAELGDDDLREIFVGAIAYDLALLQAAANESALATPEAPQPEPPRPQAPTPARVETAEDRASDRLPLAKTALELASQIEGLTKPQRHQLAAALRVSDPFDRDHDHAYLEALLKEIRRVAAAAAEVSAPARPTPRADKAAAPPRAATSNRQPPPDQPADATSAAAIAFIQHAARVYEQCFDSQPSSKASGTFARVLKVIAKATAVPVPSQARVLNQALSQTQSRTQTGNQK